MLVGVSSLKFFSNLAFVVPQSDGAEKSAQLPPASDMKTAGLIGGTSWDSTFDYYRYINEAVNDTYGNNTNSHHSLHDESGEKFTSAA